MGYYNYRYSSGEKVTKGEIIVCIIAFIIWTTVGIMISNQITYHTIDSNQRYYKALKFDQNREAFEYAMKTSSGEALVYGDFKTEVPISLPEMTDKFTAIKVVTERYNQHTRTVTEKDSEGNTHTHIETYEEWDTARTDYFYADKIFFLNREFDNSKFEFKNFQSIKLTSDNTDIYTKIRYNKLYDNNHIGDSIGDKRYSYYGVPIEFNATIFANLKDNSVFNPRGDDKKVDVFNGTIDEYMEHIENTKYTPNIIFFIFWYIAYGVLAYFFVMQRNKWADL